MVRAVIVNSELVAYCGLYCGACKQYLNEKCPGCHQNEKAGWCKIRTCNIEKGILTCAECDEYSNPKACKKFDNFISRVFGLIFRSDRAACIAQIKEMGIDGHAQRMAELGLHSIRK